MELIEKKMEMRTIKRDEFVDYFIKLNGKDVGNGRIVGKGWEVDIGQEKTIALGAMFLISVEVVLRCKRELYDHMCSEFFLEFLRGGG